MQVRQTGYGTSFGKNKVTYDDFDFWVYNGPHFDIYYYLEEEAHLDEVVALLWLVGHLPHWNILPVVGIKGVQYPGAALGVTLWNTGLTGTCRRENAGEGTGK